MTTETGFWHEHAVRASERKHGRWQTVVTSFGADAYRARLYRDERNAALTRADRAPDAALLRRRITAGPWEPED
jgi:hypothetical protein